MKATDISAFAATQQKLLDAELKAELSETANLATQFAPTVLQRAGLAILNLQVAAQRTGLGGKPVVDVELDPAVGGGEGDLPEHGIRTGDIVGLQQQPSGSAKKREKDEMEQGGTRGVVLKLTSKKVSVAMDKDDADLPGGKLWLIKLANDVTYTRMNRIMAKLEKMSDQELTPLIRILFGHSGPSSVPRDDKDLQDATGEIDWVNPSLNDSQKTAIRFALASREVALIHGPPGTGKSHSVTELILQLLKRKLRILVCGPSNISVDNLVERLSPHKVPMVRVGHPARLLPSVLNHSLDVLSRTSEAAVIVQDIRKEMDAKLASVRKTRSGRERRVVYDDLKQLRQDYRQRERRCVDELLRSSNVVLATVHGAGGYDLKNEQFDVVIIDEASQALEAQCWVPLISAKKVVLAGDHLQLPPTIKSSQPKASSSSKVKEIVDKSRNSIKLEVTLFDRLLSLHGPSIKKMLTTQYRMHEKIMEFPSQEMYESKLIAAESVKTRLLKDLEYGVKETDDTVEPVVFWDTQGEFPEKAESAVDGKEAKKRSLADSRSNEMEAMLVRLHVSRLVDAGVMPEDIAVITPYNAQLSILSQLLRETWPGMELGSVDGFQGREKEAVILSLVRSNEQREVGFLSDERRLNVAMTRPKRHLCVICDSETIRKGGHFLKRWMNYLEENANLRYPDPAEIQHQTL